MVRVIKDFFNNHCPLNEFICDRLILITIVSKVFKFFVHSLHHEAAHEFLRLLWTYYVFALHWTLVQIIIRR
jgi:hypothetical protein